MTRRLLCFCLLVSFCSACFAQDSAPAQEPAQSTAPAPAPGVTSTAGSEVEQFQKIEDKWDDAVNMRDQYSLELVLSPVFVGIAANGDISTRNQQLAGVISEPDKTLHLEQKVITVRLLGDTAVANGTYVLHHKVGSNAVDEKGVFTHVFQRLRNSWVCVNSQQTVLREDGPPGKGKKKPSEGDLPFHIPLFSK
jgi:ketosteroid isomerase-like protein